MSEQSNASQRCSGVLLHPTSLPGPFGCGDLGPVAHHFAKQLSDAGQRWWQMLPICPTSMGNSPYLSPSSFAGNPVLVSLDDLCERGLLSAADLRPTRGFTTRRVNFPATIRFRESRLRLAYERFAQRASRADRAALDEFRNTHGAWLDDHALFSAIKAQAPHVSWDRWDSDLRARKPAALDRARRDLADVIRYHEFVQFIFDRQWHALREHCRALGVGLIGDVPIYVGHDSADVWANQDAFLLDRAGRPKLVGGVPPDQFSKTGQLWGNPLYRWDALARRGYDWWVERFRITFERFDVVRLDHFIGFHNYYAIPGDAKTAEHGRWLAGPDAPLFEAIRKAIGDLPFIAEDLGKLTPGVLTLRDSFNLPGMKILQSAFGRGRADSTFLPHHYPRHCVVYTGTHDNDTVVGWFDGVRKRARSKDGEKARAELAFALQYLDTDGREIHWDLIRAAWASIANLAVVPVQDLLGLDSSARMNFPGTSDDNWEWRYEAPALSERILQRLRALTETYGRLVTTDAASSHCAGRDGRSTRSPRRASSPRSRAARHASR